MNENILCARIAQLRRDRGFTQEQLADRLGISFQAVSKWENSQSCPDIMLLPSLADIFDVSIDSLFGRETEGLVTIAADAQAGDSLGAFPWPDDDGFYAVLFRGHRVVETPQKGMDLNFHYSGPALNVSSSMDLILEDDCDIDGDISAGGNVICHRDIDCGGINGDVHAAGDVDCGGVSGSVTAEGDVDCSAVGGDVSAGGDVDCGTVGGNVNAGGDVDCGAVGGSVNACGGVDYRRQNKDGRGGVFIEAKTTEPVDLSDLGATISKAVQESMKTVQDALRGKFKNK